MRESNETNDLSPVPHDEVEQVLAALATVDVPEGLEARVTAAVRLRLGAGEGCEFRWWDAVRGTGPAAGIWWRGLLSGAAGATVCVGAVLAVQHGLARHEARGNAIAMAAPAVRRMPILRNLPIERSAVATPCDPLNEAKRVRPARATGAGGLRLVSTEGTPIRVPQTTTGTGLTAQERELLVLARRPDPVVQASLNQELRAKAEAEDAAQFESFFYHPPVQFPTEDDNATRN